MHAAVSDPFSLSLTLQDQDATLHLARTLADLARPGLVVLLDGPVGAGKTTLARQIIQTRLAKFGQIEDVPSPTFTLVQTYDLEGFDIWHADLYRLNSTNELSELGLDLAFETAFCLVEWPDRLGSEAPDHLRVELAYGTTETERLATITANGSAKSALAELQKIVVK